MNDASEKNDSADFRLVCMYVLAFFSNFVSLETFLYFFSLVTKKLFNISTRCFDLENEWKKNINCEFLFEIKLVLVFKPLKAIIVSKNWNWDLRLEEIRIEINLILRHGIIRQLHICESELLPTVTIFSEHLIKKNCKIYIRQTEK